MYKINNENYYTEIYKSTTKHRLKISLDNNDLNTKYLKKFKLDDYCFSDDFFSLGGATLCSVEMEIDKDAFNNLTISEGSKFYFEEIVTINNQDVTIPIGYFFVHLDLLDTKDDYVYKFVLYDKLYDLIQATIDFSEKIDDEDFTRLELVKLICTTYGIELGSTEFINSDKIVATYDNQLSCVSWLSFCAERAGGFVKIGRDGKLYIKSFGNVDKVVIPSTTRGETIKGDIKTITGVTYQNATQCFNAGNSTGVVVYLSQDNYFSCTQEEVDAIYNNLKNINFQSLKVRVWGDSSIDTGDIIQIGDLVTFCQKSWVFGNGFYGYYDAQIKEAKNSLDVKKLNNNQKLRRAYSLIDEVNGRVDIAVENIDDTSKSLAGLTINVNNIATNVSNTYQELNDKITNSASSNDIKEIKESVERLQTSTSDSINIINETLENGVSKVRTEKGFTFDNNGMSIDDTNSPTKSITDTNGVQVIDKSGNSDNELLFAGYDEKLLKSIVRVANMWAKIYFSIGNNHDEGDWRLEIIQDETYGNGLGFFLMGGDN